LSSAPAYVCRNVLHPSNWAENENTPFRLRELITVKPNVVWTLILSFMFVAGTSLFSQDNQDTSPSNSTFTYSTPSRPAPAWQKLGSTGLPTQNWWIQFDRAGNMYVSSNNPSAGGVSKSRDHGYHWTVINTGFSCHLHRGMGLAPDGTVFVGNDYCGSFHEGPNHFYCSIT